MKRSKIIPLRTLDLKSKPLNQCALAWSSDAELAVAGDDSIYVFLPEFPVLDPDTSLEDDEDNGDSTGSQSHVPSDAHQQAGGMSVLPAGLSFNRDPGDEDNEDELLSSDSEAEADGGTGGDYDMGLDGALGQNAAAAAALGVESRDDTSDPRQQFADGCRQFPISHPYLAPELNSHVWEAAGKKMPLIHSNVRDELGHDMSHIMIETIPDNDTTTTTTQVNEFREGGGGELIAPCYEANHHPGAGVGVIGSAGSTLNHVVAIGWSPAGLGRNLRPVLAVLTGCGSLAVYGEGGPLPFGSTARPLRSIGTQGRGAVRDLQSWLVLWAVGENFVVPGQEEYGYGEYVKAFAWCQEIGPGKALLAYMNDLRELVILCVGTTFRRLEDGLEEAVWNVREILRLETGGPHGQGDMSDPDFVPGGSSYSLRWSPWVKGDETWTCLLSYMDKNYIGFRRVTLNATTWNPVEVPVVTCDPQDWDGRCLHLAVDAFLEFENTVWNVSDKMICRGFIATPLIAEPFEVDLARPNPQKSQASHSTGHCNTTYPIESITNPITGLVIHPVDLQTVSPSLVPFYTAVRLSATATNTGWWESSLPQRPNGKEEPEWVTHIQDEITATTPLDRADRTGGDGQGDNGSESGDDGVERDEDMENNEDNSDNEDEEEDEDRDEDDATMAADRGAHADRDVYPKRMLIWGITISPGGGSTAVLATSQLTHKPERGTWNSYRSRVLFECKERRRWRRNKVREDGRGENEDWDNEEDDDDEGNGSNIVSVEGLSTEARLWEWMYGGGPGVPSITYYASTLPAADDTDANVNAHRNIVIDNPRRAAQEAKDAEAHAYRDRIKALFTPLVASQTCGICADGQTKLLLNDDSNHQEAIPAVGKGEDAGKKRQLDCVCENGHRVAVCGTSGLAIMEPGISRCCGVCRSRCLTVEVLIGVLRSAGRDEEAEVVSREVTGAVCMRCGGKYLD